MRNKMETVTYIGAICYLIFNLEAPYKTMGNSDLNLILHNSFESFSNAQLLTEIRE